MTTIDQYIHEIEFYGFTVIENVLDDDAIAGMKDALIRLEREVGVDHKHRGPARHVDNLPTLDPIFFPCIDHPRVLPVVENFLGNSLILGSLNARIVRPGDADQEFHSDVAEDMHNMASPVMVNTVWMLDDFSAANGGTRVVPGSHKTGRGAPPECFDLKHIVQTEAKAGSVLVYNGQVWHAGGGNTSDHNRHAVFGHYRKRMMVFHFDPHDNFPDQLFCQLTQRQKQLMRMERGLGADHAADAHFFHRGVSNRPRSD